MLVRRQPPANANTAQKGPAMSLDAKSSATAGFLLRTQEPLRLRGRLNERPSVRREGYQPQR
ncbi:hypothetical protein Dac01nite_00920 [Demequina activiva]|uniref:Uncharacterized protein n=1 Tax=Demequina activiva TaxID=1582364 RepID=A0A919PZ26_9MICO|nr:hypothetical protein Dac01nite_00920 [Demequina activiva]